jgi:hypothetical protein
MNLLQKHTKSMIMIGLKTQIPAAIIMKEITVFNTKKD